MSNVKISQLPQYTGNTAGTWLVMNNSGETTTYKVLLSTVLQSGTSGTSGTSGSSGDSIFAVTGSVWNTTRNVGVSGSFTVSGSAVGVGNGLNVIGNSLFSGSVRIDGSSAASSKLLVFSSASGSVGASIIHTPQVVGNSGSLSIACGTGGNVNIGAVSGSNQLAGTLRNNGSVFVTGSINVSSVIKLEKQNPLPTGTTGSLAVSGSGLYFHNGDAWYSVFLTP